MIKRKTEKIFFFLNDRCHFQSLIGMWCLHNIFIDQSLIGGWWGQCLVSWLCFPGRYPFLAGTTWESTSIIIFLKIPVRGFEQTPDVPAGKHVGQCTSVAQNKIKISTQKDKTNKMFYIINQLVSLLSCVRIISQFFYYLLCYCFLPLVHFPCNIYINSYTANFLSLMNPWWALWEIISRYNN